MVLRRRRTRRRARSGCPSARAWCSYGELAVRGNGFRQLNYTLDGVPARFLLHTIKLVEDGGSVTMINTDVLEHAALLRDAYSQRFDQRLGAGTGLRLERWIARTHPVQPDRERHQRLGDRRRASGRFDARLVARVGAAQLPRCVPQSRATGFVSSFRICRSFREGRLRPVNAPSDSGEHAAGPLALR